MVILIREPSGKERSLNLLEESWEMDIVHGDDSKVKIILDRGVEFVIERVQYDSMKKRMSESGNIIDLTRP